MRVALRVPEEFGPEPIGAPCRKKVSSILSLTLCRNFLTIVDIVCGRLQQMKLPSRIMLWHHCTLELLKYINLEKLWAHSESLWKQYIGERLSDTGRGQHGGWPGHCWEIDHRVRGSIPVARMLWILIEINGGGYTTDAGLVAAISSIYIVVS